MPAVGAWARRGPQARPGQVHQCSPKSEQGRGGHRQPDALHPRRGARIRDRGRDHAGHDRGLRHVHRNGRRLMPSTAVRPVRIVVAKVGLDGHDRGVKVVARALRDAGYEVIYTGLRQTPEMVVDAALQEDAQVIGLSIHSGAHMTLFPAVVEELKRRKATDIIVFGGGIIPDDDITALKKRGVEKIFTPGTPLLDIVDWLRKRFPDSPTK